MSGAAAPGSRPREGHVAFGGEKSNVPTKGAERRPSLSRCPTARGNVGSIRQLQTLEADFRVLITKALLKRDDVTEDDADEHLPIDIDALALKKLPDDRREAYVLKLLESPDLGGVGLRADIKSEVRKLCEGIRLAC